MGRPSPVLAAVCFLASVCGGRQAPPSAQEISFNLEEPIDHPVRLPQSVLEMLSHDPSVTKSRCLSADTPSQQPAASWFEGGRVSLEGPNRVDLIVKGKNACLYGANIGPFWVFRHTPSGYVLVLRVDALRLALLKTKSRAGYRDISASAVVTASKVATLTYRFEGNEYQQFATTVNQPNSPTH